MRCDVSVKVKELGDIQGLFWKATKKSIYIKNALLNRATNTSVAMLKIERQFIISVSRLAMPRFESFTDEELSLVSKMGNSKYNEEVSKIMTQRAKTADSQNSTRGTEKTSVKKVGKWNGNQPQNGESLDKDSDNLGGKARSGGDKKAGNSKKGKKSSQEWDQFEVNENLFGINPNFNMDEYATPIDTKAADYKTNFEKSTRIADEIMSEKTDDPHRLEERGFSRTSEMSDEKLYSTVYDGRKWDRRDKPASESRNRKVEKEERSAVVSAKCGKEAQINHELIKHKEKVNETIGGDPKVMWASLGAFLSKKKEVENKMNASPVEVPLGKQPAGQPQTGDSGVSKSPELVGNKFLKNEKGDGKASNKSVVHGSDKEHAKANRHANRDGFHGKDSSGRNANKINSRKHEESAEPKTSKQVVIGSALNFKTVADILTAITENFTSPATSVEPRSWGKGGVIEDKIDYVKNNQIYLVPSDQRLSEISSFTTYRGKK